MRNLLSLLTLPAEDQAKIGAGAPYRPYLNKAKLLKCDAQKAAAAYTATERENAAQRGLELIRRMFRDERFSAGYAEQILLEVQRHMRNAEQRGILEPSAVTWVGDVKAIGAGAKPARFEEFTGMERINGMIKWMAKVVVRVMPNAAVRERAIELALSRPNQLGA